MLKARIVSQIIPFVSFLAFLALGVPASASMELPESAKQVIFEKICEEVFFEDEGAIRAPQKLEDFRYQQVDEFNFVVSGSSYSDWDMKVIDYTCNVEVLTRGMIRSLDDVAVECTLEQENWPYL